MYHHDVVSLMIDWDSLFKRSGNNTSWWLSIYTAQCDLRKLNVSVHDLSSSPQLKAKRAPTNVRALSHLSMLSRLYKRWASSNGPLPITHLSAHSSSSSSSLHDLFAVLTAPLRRKRRHLLVLVMHAFELQKVAHESERGRSLGPVLLQRATMRALRIVLRRSRIASSRASLSAIAACCARWRWRCFARYA